jgi:hypothetical protein
LKLMLLTVMLATALTASGSHAPAVNPKPAAISGHVIGETVGMFLRTEPEAQQKADGYRQHARQTICARLLGALYEGQRAEISMSNHAAFTLEGGKLAGMIMLVNGGTEAATAGLTKKFGMQPRKTTIPSQNMSGVKWENYLFVWETPDVSVTLYADNDPSLHDRRPLLMAESNTRREQYTVSVQQLSSGFGTH